MNRSVSAGHSHPVIQVKGWTKGERGGKREAHFLIPSLHPCPKSPKNESTFYSFRSPCIPFSKIAFSLLFLNYHSSSFSFILSSPLYRRQAEIEGERERMEWLLKPHFPEKFLPFPHHFSGFRKGLSLSLLPVNYFHACLAVLKGNVERKGGRKGKENEEGEDNL